MVIDTISKYIETVTPFIDKYIAVPEMWEIEANNGVFCIKGYANKNFMDTYMKIIPFRFRNINRFQIVINVIFSNNEKIYVGYEVEYTMSMMLSDNDNDESEFEYLESRGKSDLIVKMDNIKDVELKEGIMFMRNTFNMYTELQNK
jgi:hypothetical protein